jgi:3-hydroxyisobutyrate dehydrogenase
MTKPKIGFVGIGAMGVPMASNLAKAGHRLVIYDLDRKRCEAIAATHEVEIAASLADVGRQCGTVITMLPDGQAVKQALCAKGGIADELEQGALVIDMSSSEPLGTKELGETLAGRGIGFIDAPVSGGVKGAVAASLAIMAGGDPALFERAKPLLQKLGANLFHAGPLGAGHAVKALNNYVSAAGLVAACEAVIVSKKFGLDPAVVVDIINASTGMNNTTKNKVKQFMLTGGYNAGFTVGLMTKDLRTALKLAEAMGGPADLATLNTRLWEDAVAAMGASADHTAMHKFLEGRAAGKN